MKKFLLSMGLMLIATLSSFAAETSWSVTFATGTDNNRPAWTTSSALTDVCTDGAGNLSAIASASSASPGIYGLKLGTNKGTGSIKFNIAADAQVIPTKVEVEVSANKNAASIPFVLNGKNYTLASTNTNETYATITVQDFTTELKELEFGKGTPSSSTTQGFIFVNKVTVYYNEGEAPVLSAPSITSELVEKVSKVTITAEEGAEVYYTIDGTVPTEESTHYEAPFDVYQSCTVKAIAAKNGEYSNVASYNVEMPLFLDGFAALYAPDGLEFLNQQVEIECPMTVIWQGGDKNKYLYVQDANKRNMLVYFFPENSPFNSGDTFNFLQATVGQYGNTTQLINPVFGEITAGTAIEPIEAELSQVAANTTYSYFKISGVTISDVTKQNAIVSDAAGNSVALRNQFLITEGFENAENCTITGFVSVYNGTVQFQPILIEVGSEVVAAPVISPADGASVAAKTPIEITAEEGAEIFCKTSESDEFVLYADDLVVSGQPGSTFTVEAYAEKNGVKSEIVTATYTIIKADPEVAWVNADNEPVTEFTWVIGETTIDDMPYMDGYFTVNPEVSSSNPEVATVDITATPWLTVVGPGTTVITLSVAESDEYAAGSADLTLTVVDPSSLPVTADATFDFSDFSSLNFSTPIDKPTSASTGVQIEDNTLEANGVVLSFVKNSGTGVRFWNGTEAAGTTLRVYKGSTLTLTAPTGYYVTAVAFTEVTSSNWGLNLAEGQPGTFESKEWTASADDKASAVTFEVPAEGTNTYIKAISVSCAKILSGVADIEAADDNAPVEYFNLQGIRVENPANGLYIRRQGSKVSKVIL